MTFHRDTAGIMMTLNPSKRENFGRKRPPPLRRGAWTNRLGQVDEIIFLGNRDELGWSHLAKRAW